MPRVAWCESHIRPYFLAHSLARRAIYIQAASLDCPDTMYMCTSRSDDLTSQITVASDSGFGHQGAKTENTNLLLLT
jgi:hypothetical protein